jgi:hypothetical protein
MAAVVLAVAKRPHAVFPRLAPGDACEPDQDPGQLDRPIPLSATLEHVIATHVVMDARGDTRHACRDQIAFGGMQIAARGIAAQRPCGLAMGFPGRQSEGYLEQGRDGVEVERTRRGNDTAA